MFVLSLIQFQCSFSDLQLEEQPHTISYLNKQWISQKRQHPLRTKSSLFASTHLEGDKTKVAPAGWGC